MRKVTDCQRLFFCFSDPVGIQTQDLQNRNQSFKFNESPFIYWLLRQSSNAHLRRFCADSALLLLSCRLQRYEKEIKQCHPEMLKN